ncbi:hypothetical protein GALL_527520 [mine drainage metagenome]|uniref:Uncharacterized protein n=1 Tax=mine drainage metagenome TaxID=410659 RepID=A0A1J5P3E8_9ZZZZ
MACAVGGVAPEAAARARQIRHVGGHGVFHGTDVHQEHADDTLQPRHAQGITQQLAHQRRALDRKILRQTVVGILLGIGEGVVPQMMVAIALNIEPDRTGAQPVGHAVVETTRRKQGAVRRLVHQDGQRQLTPAEHQHHQNISCRVRPASQHREAGRDHGPGRQHAPPAGKIGALSQAADFVRAEQFVDSNAAG